MDQRHSRIGLRLCLDVLNRIVSVADDMVRRGDTNVIVEILRATPCQILCGNFIKNGQWLFKRI